MIETYTRLAGVHKSRGKSSPWWLILYDDTWYFDQYYCTTYSFYIWTCVGPYTHSRSRPTAVRFTGQSRLVWAQYGTCCRSHFRRPESGDGSKILGKSVDLLRWK
jgi:hypothetical protein